MADVAFLLIVLLVIGAVIAYAATQLGRTGHGRAIDNATFESEAARHWYRKAQHLARLLDRVETDDMIAVTIPPELRSRIRAAVDDFFEEDGPKGLPR